MKNVRDREGIIGIQKNKNGKKKKEKKKKGGILKINPGKTLGDGI